MTLVDLVKLGLLVVYLVVVFWLSYLGMRKTKSLSSFAIGNRDMGPVLVGIVMASSIASTATFVINPGFVYTHGLSALLHYGVAAQAGIAFGLVTVSRGFRKVAEVHGCLTLPDWIKARYESPSLEIAFALLNLLALTFVVLIMVGCALILVSLVELSYGVALTIILVVVFSYVLMGGTYAHTYTNAVQGVMMLVVALALFGSGLHWLVSEGVVGAFERVGPEFAAAMNPTSELYGSFFSVFISAFVVTFALMLQPHVMTKLFYLRNQRDLRVFLATTIAVGLVYGLVLFVGLYARLDELGLPVERQDEVVAQYVGVAFGEGAGAQVVSAAVGIALLAAGMSTLDGILVALSAMVTHDLVLRGRTEVGAGSQALAISRWVLVGVGLVSYAIALDPPRFVGLFAQKGVYGLAAASFVPVVLGVLGPTKIPGWIASTGAAVALVVHFTLDLAVGVANPAVCACIAILVSSAVSVAALRWASIRGQV